MIEYLSLEWEVIIFSLWCKFVALKLCSSPYRFGTLDTSVQFDVRGMEIQTCSRFSVFFIHTLGLTRPVSSNKVPFANSLATFAEIQ